ncbi:MAG: bifunctional DNA-formamidopyrimidine glycosylase/DNA-(apurinic or apyrimidinic site) lyase [Magnetococcales bacterium]|nr:bifunctional DNA-formamidopyrimidine glycosylase/DNA-(apurinic or apyrimidinic site) lyase [Magnetococcales bacterium]
MPELPEVETVKRGLHPYVVGHLVQDLCVRRGDLRWPVPEDTLKQHVVGKPIQELRRRGKYLLFRVDSGWMIVHLGMSGVLRFTVNRMEPDTHDHLIWSLDNGYLIYNDPRRFGAVLWQEGDSPENHSRLSQLGPEPLSEQFSVGHLATRFAQRRATVKQLIMDAGTVVGVGNIYASESLFEAGISPMSRAGSLTTTQLQALCEAIKRVLERSIEAGGTTLRDFVGSDGRPGYFSQSLQVYGRDEKPCKHCGEGIKHRKMAGRATYWCPNCQR